MYVAVLDDGETTTNDRNRDRDTRVKALGLLRTMQLHVMGKVISVGVHTYVYNVCRQKKI